MSRYDFEFIKKHHASAKYVAMNSDGLVFSYSEEPYIFPIANKWVGKETCEIVGPYNLSVFSRNAIPCVSWKDSLEKIN